jgi:hypothetical protein
VAVVVRNERGGKPAADEKDDGEHSREAEVTETQEEVSCIEICDFCSRLLKIKVLWVVTLLFEVCCVMMLSVSEIMWHLIDE